MKCFEERGDRFAGEVKMALRMFNPGAAALNLKAALRFEQSERPEVAETATLAVEAGGVAEIVLARTESGRARCRVTAEVTDAETGESYFLHQNAWNYEPRVPWEAPFQRGHFALRWRFRDFPSENLLRVEADIRNMPANAGVERVRAVLREKGTGREVVSIAIDRFDGGRRELDIPLPAELEGDFELAAWAEGENIPAESIVDQIRRRRFAWEGQALGVTDEVFAPFELVKADGDRVSVVLREYRMGGLGLWDSVRARGQENNRLAVGADGAELDFPFAAGVYVIGHQAPEAEVLFRDDFESGLSFAWDYVSGYAEVAGGALRFLENRASWTGVPRVFNCLELPNFAAGELMILRHFNRPLEEAAELLAMFRQAESAGQRQACLVVLRELPNRQKAHVEFMRASARKRNSFPVSWPPAKRRSRRLRS